MIKKTLYFENPAYLSLKDSQMLIRLPEVERSTSVNADFKKRAERTYNVMVLLCSNYLYMQDIAQVMITLKFTSNESSLFFLNMGMFV